MNRLGKGLPRVYGFSYAVCSRLCAVRRTGPSSRTGAAGALRRAGTALRPVGEADSIDYFNRKSSNGANMLRAVASRLTPSRKL